MSLIHSRWSKSDDRSALGESTTMLPLAESHPMYLIPTTPGRPSLTKISRRIHM